MVVYFKLYLHYSIHYIPTGEHPGSIQLAVCPVTTFMDRSSCSDSSSTTSATIIVPSCAGNFCHNLAPI